MRYNKWKIRIKKSRKYLLLVPSLVVLLSLFASLSVLLVISFLDKDSFWAGDYRFTFQNYITVLKQSYYVRLLLYTIVNSALLSIVALILGYPFAYILARGKTKLKEFAQIALVFPLYGWVYFCYGLVYIFLPRGIFNSILMGLHLVSEPIMLWQSPLFVLMALTLLSIPLVVLTIHSNILGIDPTFEDAARSLGANPIQVFLRITLPLSKTGIIGGTLIAFAINTGAFIVPLIVGGAKVDWLGVAMYLRMTYMMDWGVGAALALVLFIVTLVSSYCYSVVLEK